ncbi:hypothetical protein HOY80DRAFT_881854, partial [Tuber brumale]
EEENAEPGINKIDSAALPKLSTAVHRKWHCNVMNAVGGHFEPIAHIPTNQPTRAFHPEPMSATPAFSFSSKAHASHHQATLPQGFPINSHFRTLRQAVATKDPGCGAMMGGGDDT